MTLLAEEAPPQMDGDQKPHAQLGVETIASLEESG